MIEYLILLIEVAARTRSYVPELLPLQWGPPGDAVPESLTLLRATRHLESDEG